jgi:hypothetical protein
MRQILHAARTKERVHTASECDHCTIENVVSISSEEELKMFTNNVMYSTFYLFYYLFYDVVSNSDCIASNGETEENQE